MSSAPVLPPFSSIQVATSVEGDIRSPAAFIHRNIRPGAGIEMDTNAAGQIDVKVDADFGSMDVGGADHTVSVSGGVMVLDTYQNFTTNGVTCDTSTGLFTSRTPGWYLIQFAGTISGTDSFILEAVTNNVGSSLTCAVEPNGKKTPVALNGVRYLADGVTCGVSVTYTPGGGTVSATFRNAQFSVTRLR